MQGATIHRATTNRTLTETDLTRDWSGTTIPCPSCEGRVRWESAAYGRACPHCRGTLALTVSVDD